MAYVRMTHPSKGASPAWTFQGNRTNENRNDCPGPGNYSPGKTDKQSGGAFGRSTRDEKNRHDSPGPGAYHDAVGKKEGPQYSIRAKTGHQGSRMNNPGPGNYNPFDGKFDKDPAYTMAGKKAPKYGDYNPGPGTYEFARKGNKSAAVFGSSTRDHRASEQVPGPGGYEVRKDKPEGQKSSFGKATRSSLGEGAFAPGPGTYKAKPTLGKRGVSMTPRRADLSSQAGKDTPGPGTYGAEHAGVVKSASVKFGKSSRDGMYKSTDVPGPGNYSIKQRPSTAQSFGKSQRSSLTQTENTPGPGNYRQQKEKGGPGYTMCGRNERNHDEAVPGPGKYGYAMAKSSKQGVMKIGTGKRDSRKIEDVPGPGIYQMKSTLSGPKHGFGTSSRSEKPKEEYGSLGNVPAAFPNVAKYALPQDVITRYSVDY